VDQVVVNLVSNAIKFGQGKPVDISVIADKDQAQLRIQDRGIGVAPEDQARIFGRFERAVSAKHYGGLGVGLWLSRQLVEAMGGTVKLESTLGEGSTFTVRLPLKGAVKT
jgi:signal transduction histidine kinase